LDAKYAGQMRAVHLMGASIRLCSAERKKRLPGDGIAQMAAGARCCL